ncbi:hypothetical protein HBI29_070960 [Parastagonospora nodorum]|nr:hypothetical protein HBH75_018670 [Parastagonospora nodorum]KAH5323268.1 hypothetical protein HBI11_041040 [Parastagonospora nodorum]KAH5519359.1 hypothetical protein HBI29_070960 [Parastagonospora nodorum]
MLQTQSHKPWSASSHGAKTTHNAQQQDDSTRERRERRSGDPKPERRQQLNNSSCISAIQGIRAVPKLIRCRNLGHSMEYPCSGWNGNVSRKMKRRDEHVAEVRLVKHFTIETG